MNQELNIELLITYLSGNCSNEQQMLVEDWIAMSDENTSLFDEYRRVWDGSSTKKESLIIDIDKSWDNFKKRANFVEDETVEEKSLIRRYLTHAVSIAALLLIAITSFFVFNGEKPLEQHNYTAFNVESSSPFMLPDGTEVSMNNGAEIKYPDEFSDGVRKVSFKGEAFFDVVSNPEIPMIIECGNARIKVLGTSFNLNNNDISNEVSLYLESGKVMFYTVDENNGELLEQIILSPGEKGVFNKTTGIITKDYFNNNNHLAWKTGALDFVKTPLGEVIDIIERTYDVKVDSKTNLKEFKLTARFQDETPESIFESISVVYGFSFEINDNRILIY